MAAIDALTLPEFAMLCRYWRKQPPSHLVLAAALGIGPSREAPSADYADLFRLFGGSP